MTLAREPGGYALNTDPMSVDLHRFRHVVRQARGSREPLQAADLFERALSIWRGEPFPALDTPWINGLRSTLLGERLSVVLDRNDVALRVGRHSEVLVELTAAHAAHPLDERLAGQLMLAGSGLPTSSVSIPAPRWTRCTSRFFPATSKRRAGH